MVSNPECGKQNVIAKPDYYGYYMLYGEGDYSVSLTAITENGTKTISDSFRVAEELPYSVERVGPTRIYPLADYTMKMIFKFEEDFNGDIIEKAAYRFPNFQFSIFNFQTIFPRLSNKQYPISNIKIKGIKRINLRILEFLAGEEYWFSYDFDAPDVSPEFYLLGPVEIKMDGDLVFVEERKWQIASDVFQIAYATNGTNVNWVNAANAWDNTNNTHARRDIPNKNVDDSGSYLRATVNDATDLGGVINSVEIGFEGIGSLRRCCCLYQAYI
jgi:hypothetical protein